MPRLVQRPAHRAGRRGFTLPELLVAIVLFGIVSAAVLKIVDRQQKFYGDVTTVMSQRAQLRQATALMGTALRSISSIGGDVIAISDSAVEVRAHIGSAIVCQIDGTTTISVPPESLASGAKLSALTYGIVPGDIAFVYNDSVTRGTEDDRWQQFDVVDSDADPSVCTGAPFTDASGDAGKPRYRVTLTGDAISPYVQVGAPVRFARRVRFRLYQAGDGQWYLGIAAWNGGGYGALSPVAGPYRSHATGTGAQSGFALRYYDEAGAEITGVADAARIARIDVVARALSSKAVRADGLKSGNYADSLAVQIAIRNRS